MWSLSLLGDKAEQFLGSWENMQGIYLGKESIPVSATVAVHNLFQCWEAEWSEGGQSILGRPQDETVAGG